MRVDKHHPDLQQLKGELQELRDQLSKGGDLKDSSGYLIRSLSLEWRLRKIVASWARPFVGQVALVYHEFLIKGPRIDVPKKDYEVRMARLSFREIKAGNRNTARPQQENGSHHRLADSLSGLIPVVWERPLYPLYSKEAERIRFLLERRRGFEVEIPDTDASRHQSLDISPLVNDLFPSPVEDRRRNSKVTVEAAILFGTTTVENWLGQHHSLEAFHILMAPKKTVV